MKKTIATTLVAASVVLGVSACASDAEVASHNISKVYQVNFKPRAIVPDIELR